MSCQGRTSARASVRASGWVPDGVGAALAIAQSSLLSGGILCNPGESGKVAVPPSFIAARRDRINGHEYQTRVLR
jgi:hypothetical protein